MDLQRKTMLDGQTTFFQFMAWRLLILGTLKKEAKCVSEDLGHLDAIDCQQCRRPRRLQNQMLILP